MPFRPLMKFTTVFGLAALACVVSCKRPPLDNVHLEKAVMSESVPQPLVSDEAGVITTRAKWPLGVPLHVRVNPSLFVDSKPQLLHVLAELPQAIPITIAVSGRIVLLIDPGPEYTWQDQTHHAGTPLLSCNEILFRYSLTHPEGEDPTVLSKPTALLKVPVRVDGNIDDIIKGEPLPDLDASLMTELNARLYLRGHHSQGMPRLWVGTYTNCEGAVDTPYPGICHVLAKNSNVTFAGRFEVIRDSKVVAWTVGWWRGTDRSVNPIEGMLALTVVDEALLRSDAKDSKWQLHIKSDPEMALRDFESTRYWEGEVWVPLRVTDTE